MSRYLLALLQLALVALVAAVVFMVATEFLGMASILSRVAY
jgi:hypothetical protein